MDFKSWMDEALALMDDPSLLMTFVIIIISYIVHIIVRRIFLDKILRGLVKKTRAQWDDVFFDHHVLDILTWLIPLGVISNLSNNFVVAGDLINRFIQVLVFFVVLILISRTLNCIRVLYNRTEFAKSFPFPPSYMSLIRVFLSVIGILIAITILMGKSPFALVTGLGAFSAVLMLVFKDTILSFVANVVISSQDLIKEGDWVEIPSFKADGDVIEIGLHIIKVQNFDKTISTIPTRMILDTTVKNWRGMSASGVRRIKRSLSVDLKSVRHLSVEEIDQYKAVPILSDYIKDKMSQIKNLESAKNNKTDVLVQRQLTNIGTFRKYIELYLKQHPDIDQEQSLLVRQLQSGKEGIPIEIYCFVNTTVWGDYEIIQSDIFDHLLSVAESFELKVFQFPSSVFIPQ